MLYFILSNNIPVKSDISLLLPNTSNPELLSDGELKALGIYRIPTQNGILSNVEYDPITDTIVPTWESIVYPEWDGFKAALLADSEFSALYIAARSINPLLTDALIPALLRYESGNTQMFSSIFEPFVQASGMSESQRQGLRTIAEGYHLPVDFLNIIYGD